MVSKSLPCTYRVLFRRKEVAFVFLSRYISDDGSDDNEQFYECSPTLERGSSEGIDSVRRASSSASASDEDWIK